MKRKTRPQGLSAFAQNWTNGGDNETHSAQPYAVFRLVNCQYVYKRPQAGIIHYNPSKYK